MENVSKQIVLVPMHVHTNSCISNIALFEFEGLYPRTTAPVSDT